MLVKYIYIHCIGHSRPLGDDIEHVLCLTVNKVHLMNLRNKSPTHFYNFYSGAVLVLCADTQCETNFPIFFCLALRKKTRSSLLGPKINYSYRKWRTDRRDKLVYGLLLTWDIMELMNVKSK